jgi:hypothetical protein
MSVNAVVIALPRLTPPPFDPMLTTSQPPTPVGVDASQDRLPLTFAAPSQKPWSPAPLRTRHLVLVHADPARDRVLGGALDPEDESDGEFSRRLTPRQELPDPQMWISRFSQAAVEILAGRRSPLQMLRWTNRVVYAQLANRSGAIEQTPHVRRIRICEPADGIVEASVIALASDRCRAMALRFEGLDGRWICTAMTIG